MILSPTVADMNHRNTNDNDGGSLCACVLNSTKGIFTISGRFGITQMRSLCSKVLVFIMKVKHSKSLI